MLWYARVMRLLDGHGVAGSGLGHGAALPGLALALLLAAAPAPADTWIVRPDGSGDQPTIQAAIAAAAPGDRIELADGIFTGPGNVDVDFLGKAVVVCSQSADAQACAIDCRGSASDPHRGFLFQSGEDAGAQLLDLTVRNGYAEEGGALLCRLGGSPTLRGCRFLENHATFGGALLADHDGLPEVEQCLFLGNSATTGGAIETRFASLHVRECEFRSNLAGCGGAVAFCFPSQPVLERCLLVGNSASEGGGVYW